MSLDSWRDILTFKELVLIRTIAIVGILAPFVNLVG